MSRIANFLIVPSESRRSSCPPATSTRPDAAGARVAILYAVLFHDFGDHEHVFMPVRVSPRLLSFVG